SGCWPWTREARPAAVLRLARASWGKASEGDQAPAEFARLALRGRAATHSNHGGVGPGGGRAERLRHGRRRLGRAAARGARRHMGRRDLLRHPGHGDREEEMMKIFLDTASVSELREGVAMGLVDGCTTNPSLIAK